MYFPPSSAVKLGVQNRSNRRRVSGGENFLRRNDIDIPTAGDFFSRRFTAAMFAGSFLHIYMFVYICDIYINAVR